MKRTYEYWLFGENYEAEFTEQEKSDFENTYGTVCILKEEAEQ